MNNLKIIIFVLPSLIISTNSIQGAVSNNKSGISRAANLNSSVQADKSRTEADELREIFSNSRPLPGSHFDENYRVVIDDPEIYQKALEKENSTVERNFSVQPKQVKSKQEARNASSANWKPLPGSHFDENYHVVIDDPEVYQKALEKENNTAEGNSPVQPKRQRTLQESINASRAKWKPLPGSHFDENYHVVIDDPEVYQKALEKEQAQNEGKFDYQNIKPQEDPREQNIFYRLYKYNPILGILATIPLVCLAVVLLRFRDFLRKKKE